MALTFSRKELQDSKSMTKQRLQEITVRLLEKLNNNESLTLAESKFICLNLKTIYSADTDEIAFKAENFKQCSDFLFWEKYILYWSDHEGWGQIKDSKTTFVSPSQKVQDVELLQMHYEQWREIIYGDTFPNTMIQTIANETKRLIKELTTISKDRGEGANHQRYIEKALILHSKYLYYQVQEFYEENNPVEETINLCGELVVIDNFVYIHTLFGHFAAAIKFGRSGKSYHSVDKVDYKNLPKEILSILAIFSKTVDCKHFDKQSIFFNYHGSDFAIWFRPLARSVKKIGQQSILRVQTFYPVELADDLKKIAVAQKVKANDDLYFYIPT